MRYKGGKNNSGCFQQIINQLPPHQVYVEPFLGSGAILRIKKKARLSIGIEADRASLDSTMLAITEVFGDSCRRLSPETALVDLTRSTEGVIAIDGDALSILPALPIRRDWLVYADPPYLGSTRTREFYRQEIFTDAEHKELLSILKRLDCMVAISGYPSPLYSYHLDGWRCHQYQVINRACKMVTECLWMNYPEPMALHDYRFLGANFREREKLKRRKQRWTARLKRMPLLERASLFMAISAALDENGEPRETTPPARPNTAADLPA
jgi:DNA adenine methylase